MCIRSAETGWCTSIYGYSTHTPMRVERNIFAHFRQLVRSGAVQISRAEPTDIVPAGQEVFWGSHEFPWNSFLTPTEKVEQILVLGIDDIFMQKALTKHLTGYGSTMLGLHECHIMEVLSTPIDFIITDLFYYYRLEQPATSCRGWSSSGIVFHPISGNGLLYEWLVLHHQYPDKTV